MNSDIRISSSFFSHPKAKRLSATIGRVELSSLIELWTQVSLSKPSGVLDGWDEVDISLASGTSMPSSEFVSSLVDLSFLDLSEDVYSIHNWKKHQPWAAGADERSIDASKRAAYRWCIKDIKKEDHEEFKKWFFEKYQHKQGNNASSIRDAYRTHCATHAKRNAPIPSPLPIPSPNPKQKEKALSKQGKNNTICTTHAREEDPPDFGVTPSTVSAHTMKLSDGTIIDAFTGEEI